MLTQIIRDASVAAAAIRFITSQYYSSHGSVRHTDT